MKNILMTGATGFLGGWLVKRLNWTPEFNLDEGLLKTVEAYASSPQTLAQLLACADPATPLCHARVRSKPAMRLIEADGSLP